MQCTHDCTLLAGEEEKRKNAEPIVTETVIRYARTTVLYIYETQSTLVGIYSIRDVLCQRGRPHILLWPKKNI